MRTTEVASEIEPHTAYRRRAAFFDRPTLILALALSLAVLAVYLLTLSHNYSPDSMSFALLADRGQLSAPLFFMAEHLLWPFLGWAWYHLWLVLDYGQGPIVPLQLLNAIAGAAGVGLFFLSLKAVLGKSNKGTPAAVFAALVLAFSYGYWYHSTEAEDQIIANALTLVAFLILATIVRETRAGPDSLVKVNAARVDVGVARASGTTRKSTLVILGLVMGLAIMAHGTAVLFLPALGLGLWLKSRRLGEVLALLAGVVALVALGLVVAGALAHGLRSPVDYLSWLLSAPSNGVWGRPSLRSLWTGAQGLANAVVFLQGGPGFKALLGGAFQLRNALAAILFLAVAALSLAAILSLAIISRDSGRRTIALVCLVWIVAVGLFDLYWAPEDIQFWIALVPPLIVALALAHQSLIRSLPGKEELLNGAFAFGLAVVFVIDLLTAAIPRSDLAANAGLAKAICLGQSSNPGDLFVTPGWDWASGYGPYFAKRQVLSIVDSYLLEADGNRARFLQLLNERIAATQASGGKIYVVRLFSMDENDGNWLKRTTGLVSDDFRFPRQQAWTCGGEVVWEIAKQ